MNRSIVVLCLTLLMGVAVAGTTGAYFEQGDGTVTEDNISISETNNGTVELQLARSANLHYTPNSSWDNTTTEIGPTHSIFLKNASAGDSGEWRRTPVNARSVTTAYLRPTNVTASSTRIHVLNASSPVNLNSGAYGDMTVGRTTDSVTLYQFQVDDEKTDVRWRAAPETAIQFRDLPSNESIGLRNQNGDLVNVVETEANGQLQHTTHANWSISFETGVDGTFDNFTVGPIFQRLELSRSQESIRTYTMEIENNGDSVRRVNISSDDAYLTPNREEIVISSGGSETVSMRVNETLVPEGYTIGETRISSQNGNTTTYIGIEAPPGITGAGEVTFFGFPTWLILSVAVLFLFALFGGLWLIIEPSDNPNPWV